jgi:hypothetical protein
VAHIDKVFARAERVTVWLGEAIDDSDLAMDKIPHLSKHFRKTDLAIIRDLGPEHACLRPSEHPVWLALNSLLDQELFQRFCIVQEAVLAKQLVFLCGQKTVTYEQFLAVNASMTTSGQIHWSRRTTRWVAMKNDILVPIEHARQHYHQTRKYSDLIFSVLNLSD